MADFLIQHLRKKSGEHSALEMLSNQWGFDEKLIPKALQSVGNLFPHYSRHDESHSKQILVNIERLLGGENISRLTATDTWLLLEAAYWHDIGMVVPHRDFEEAFNNPHFSQYILQIRNSQNHELNRFSLSFDPHDLSRCFCGADTPLDAIDKFRQLLAEWFRQHHAGRANSIIQAPWEFAGISSPRTELIPARLFKLLGRVCHMHGLPFKELLGPNGLPYREAGLAQEDCHPRFVACLLRMGDLLDLDDNRFCPVMQRISGENRSRISKAHEDKHSNIRHLRVDRERIEITAECETVDGYLETFKWFDWLKQEIQDQMAHWQDIVPTREFGLLPTLGNIVVRLSGQQQLLKEGQRPQFGIDEKQAINLLQGSNLYGTKFACIRELLQNAVDATLLRLWLTHEKTEPQETWKSPFTDKAKLILGQSLVEVSFSEVESDADTPPDKMRWLLKIKDQGTGISRDDLGHMLRIGGSQGNLNRQIKINNMPEWMKPSGAFGIGFQSVFLISDVVKLTTKSIFTNEILEVIMHSPVKDKEGLVALNSKENDISVAYGTTVEVIVYVEKYRNSYSIRLGDTESFIVRFLNLYDPVLDDALPIESADLADKIQKFLKHSLVPIKGTLSTGNKCFNLGVDGVGASIGYGQEDWRYVESCGHLLALQYLPNIDVFPRDIEAFYRGQPFEAENIGFPGVDIKLNLLSGKAGKWLTINRDRLASCANQELHTLALSALKVVVEEDLNSANIDEQERRKYSFFLELMAFQYGGCWQGFADRLDGAWLDLAIIHCDGHGLSMNGSELLTFRVFFQKEDWTVGVKGIDKRKEVSCDLLLEHGLVLNLILHQWLVKNDRTIQIATDKNDADDGAQFIYKLSTKPQPTFSPEALPLGLINAVRSRNNNMRYLLDLPDDWSILYLKDGINIRASYLLYIRQRGQKMILLPFLFYTGFFSQDQQRVTATPEQVDALCKWVLPNLQSHASLVEIKNKYYDLIKYIDDEVMKNSKYWIPWKEARGI